MYWTSLFWIPFAILLQCQTQTANQENNISGNAKNQEVSQLICSGTEPFWSLKQNGEYWIYNNMATEVELKLTSKKTINAAGRQAGYIQLIPLFHEDKPFAKLTLRKTSDCPCSDGMSDIKYAYSALLIQDNSILLEGCAREE